MAPQRTAATLNLWRLLSGKPHSGRSRLSNARRKRLGIALRSLDARLSGATYRDIAQRLYGLKRLEDEPWKTSSLRTATIRLVASGLAMMRGGYRHLLRVQ